MRFQALIFYRIKYPLMMCFITISPFPIWNIPTVLKAVMKEKIIQVRCVPSFLEILNCIVYELMEAFIHDVTLHHTLDFPFGGKHHIKIARFYYPVRIEILIFLCFHL